MAIGKLGHAGQQEDDACGKHDDGWEMSDHRLGSAKQRDYENQRGGNDERRALPSTAILLLLHANAGLRQPLPVHHFATIMNAG